MAYDTRQGRKDAVCVIVFSLQKTFIAHVAAPNLETSSEANDSIMILGNMIKTGNDFEW